MLCDIADMLCELCDSDTNKEWIGKVVEGNIKLVGYLNSGPHRYEIGETECVWDSRDGCSCRTLS